MHTGNLPLSERVDFLSSVFADLSGDVLTELAGQLMLIRYNEGDLIIQEGAPFAGVYIVHSGLVRIGKYSSSDKRRTLRFLAPGEFFGLEAFFMSEHRAHIQFARALLDSELVFFPRHEFKACVEQHPRLLGTICRWFAREVAMLEFKLTRHSTEGSLHNVALVLSALVNKYGKPADKGTLIDLDLPRKLMAEMLGISEDTLMNALKKFKQQNVVSMDNGRIVVLEPDKLDKLALTNEFYLTILEETF